MGRGTLIYAGLTCSTRKASLPRLTTTPLVAAICDKYVAGDLAGALQTQRELAPLRPAFAWACSWW
jgi:4-hydroxy-tetrahydrodipicolinate synthase